MKPSCPCCGKADFTYRALLQIHPAPGEFAPFSVTCPSCGESFRVTTASRLLGGGVLMGLFFALAAIFWRSAHLPSQWHILALAASTVASYYFFAWPLLVRFKPWTPFRYWLPKSRLVGYSVYLFLPLVIMALVIYLSL